MDQPAGPIIDGLGVTLDLDEGSLVSDVILIAKVVNPDGQSGLAIADSDALDWITQYGLIKAAERIIEAQQFLVVGDDDD
ncbi:hypothetical protein ABZ917_17365 [Nonomuraea wenchangensis]